MNTALHTSEAGAHFRIAQDEFDTLDEIARTEFDAPLVELPIGKAANVLSIVAFAAISDPALKIVNDKGVAIAGTPEDGVEATNGVLSIRLKDALKKSILLVGRVTLKVVPNEEINNEDAESILEKEYLSQAYRWAIKVVEAHKDSLVDDGAKTPLLPTELLLEKPERGELALAHQGLTLSLPAYSGDQLEIMPHLDTL
jgi:hypothetical protein